MILVTGATGFLGKQILGRLLLQYPNEQILLLVRSRTFEDAGSRCSNLLGELFGLDGVSLYRHRVCEVCGDLSLPKFGLTDRDFEALAYKVHAVFHCAASTALNQELSAARDINVKGTENILDLVRLSDSFGNVPHLYYVSTAYVAGDTEDIVGPNELVLNRKFKNAYEQSKAESELLVRHQMDYTPVCILRPSIIVGDSITGQTSAFNVLYVPARFMARGLFKALPANPYIPFDVVPVNYVADAVVALSKCPDSMGNSYHLTAGVGRETTPIEIIDFIIKAINKYRENGLKDLRHPSFLSPEMLQIVINSLSVARTGMATLERILCKRIDVIKQTLPFIPYMIRNPQFDSSSTVDALNGKIEQPPLFAHYADRVFAYCFETNWGRDSWKNPDNLTTWAQRCHV